MLMVWRLPDLASEGESGDHRHSEDLEGIPSRRNNTNKSREV